MQNKISFIIPVIRTDAVKETIRSIHNQGLRSGDYEILTEIDHDRVGCPKMIKRLVAKAKYPLICFVGDDTILESDCIKNAIDAMMGHKDGYVLAGLNDQHPSGRRLATHWIAHRNFLNMLGSDEPFHTGYVHTHCDAELTDIAHEMGRFIWAEDAKLAHNHPQNNGSDESGDYRRVYGQDTFNGDLALYRRRKIDRVRNQGGRLGIGFPLIDEKVHVQFMVSFITMDKPSYILLMPNFPVGEMPENIASVRNNLITQALNEGCTHLLMIDTDQNYPVDCLSKMMAHGKRIVSAPVHRRYPPFDAILYRGQIGKYLHVPDNETYSGDLVDVDAIGAACMLMDTRAFIDIPAPWFEFARSKNGKPVGEDIMFCGKLKNAGYDIHVDTSIEIGHLTTYEVNRSTYELFKKFNNFQYREAA